MACDTFFEVLRSMAVAVVEAEVVEVDRWEEGKLVEDIQAVDILVVVVVMLETGILLYACKMGRNSS